MTENDFECLLISLQEKTLNLASKKRINPFLIEHALAFHEKNFRTNYVSTYNSNPSCLAYAMRYGMKTAWQTWLNLKDLEELSPFKKIVILGGGPSFELPVLLHKLKKSVTDIDVTVIDPYAKSWSIFSEVHHEMAKEMGVNLIINYIEPSDIIDQVDALKPELLVASNLLNELSEEEIIKLRVLFSKLPYFVQDLHFSKMNLLLEKFISKSVNQPFPNLQLPSSFCHLNLYGNFVNRSLYFDSKNLCKKVAHVLRDFRIRSK